MAAQVAKAVETLVVIKNGRLMMETITLSRARRLLPSTRRCDVGDFMPLIKASLAMSPLLFAVGA
jgi:hypothetical protein